MDFNQGELDFNHDPFQHGYQKWQQELDTRKKEIESRYGIIIGKPVILKLTGEDKPLEGILTIASKKLPKIRAHILLQLNNRQFTLFQIESISRI
jgi:hypothetical protein